MEDFIKVRMSNIQHYLNTPLYFINTDGEHILYKGEGTRLTRKRIEEESFPKQFFIKASDRLDSLKELQKSFNKKLTYEINQCIKSNDVTEVKNTLASLAYETLSEPRAGTLGLMKDSVNIMVDEFSENPNMLISIANFKSGDYTTIMHSINVMALTLGYCAKYSSDYSKEETKDYGLAALLHDLGKTKIPIDILTADRRLTDEEFEIIKSHPKYGYKMIVRDKLNETIQDAALQHHEKLDGSGYPNGIKKISHIGQLIGIIDCYEALTNDDRHYRTAEEPLAVLAKYLKPDTESGKFNKGIFINFVRLLGSQK